MNLVWSLASYPGVLPLFCQAHHSRLLCSGSQRTRRSESRSLCPAAPPHTDPALLTVPSWACGSVLTVPGGLGSVFALGRSCQARHRVDSGGCFLPLLRNSVWHVPFSPPRHDEGTWICECSFPLLSSPPSGNLPAFHLWGGKA